LYLQNNNNENGGKIFELRMSLASVKYGKYAHLVPDVVAYMSSTGVLVSSKTPLSIYNKISYFTGLHTTYSFYVSTANYIPGTVVA
jgi:O-glycosyl hydrolase